ncbi:hypothetical protein L3Q67_02285 [Saccharothrix sp. AJ9571]|nr:hypothetical protein L3Q67_02285 [Saccharothrix sp. AJ9571]
MTTDAQKLIAELDQFMSDGGWEAMTPPVACGQGLTHAFALRPHSDGTIDVLVVHAVGAIARRESPTGQLLWSCPGRLGDVLQALRKLPDPGHPDAPSDPMRDRGEEGP